MSVRTKPLPSLVLAGVLAVGLLGLGRSAAGSPYEPTRHTLGGTDVAIYNLLGNLEVVRGEGASVVAEVTLHGKDAVKLQVENGPIDGRQSLRVIYPGDRIVNPEFGDHTTSTFRVNDDGTFNDDKHGGRRVTMSGRGPGIEAGADIRLLVPAGKKVHVYWGHGKASVTRTDADLALDAAGMPVSATGIRGSLSVDIGSGMVRVEGADAEIAIDTGSGDVSLSAVHGKGVTVDTGSGEVTGNDISAESATIDTGSGDIRLGKFGAERVSLETGSGEVTVEIAGDNQSLEIDAGSGDVTVTIPKALGAELSVETGSGGIETNLTMQTSVRKHDALVGKIGDGRGRIAIETGSGTVSIKQAGL
jgi:lia operon protein LiaG